MWNGGVMASGYSEPEVVGQTSARSTEPAATPSSAVAGSVPVGLSPQTALALQRAVGNRAVANAVLAAQRSPEKSVALAAASTPSTKLAELVRHMDEGRWDVDDLAAALTDDEMRALSVDVRIRLVAYVGGGNVVSDEDEGTIVRLLSTAPITDAKAILARLQERQAALFGRLERGIHGDEYGKYQAELKKLFFASMDPKEASERMQSAREFPWADPGLLKAVSGPRFVYERAEFTEEGKIAFEWFSKGPIGPITHVRHEALVDPLELIRVRFYIGDTEFGGKKDQIVYMPAVNFLALVHGQHRRDIGRAVDLALVVGGVGALGAASRLGRVVAAVDLAMGVGGVVIDDYREDIAASENGRQFLEVWDTVQTLYAIYGAVRLLASAPEVFRRLRDAAGRWRSSGARALSQEARAGVEGQVDEILAKAEQAEKEALAAKNAGDTPPAPAKGTQGPAGDVPSQVSPPADKGGGPKVTKLPPGPVPTDSPTALPKETAPDLPEGTHAVGPTPKPRTSTLTDAEMLAANLTKKFGTRPLGHHAHHIVPKGMQEAEEAREILRRCDIGINDVDNGVWLPKDQTITNPNTGDIHAKIHTSAYIRWVTGLLQKAEATGGAKAVRLQLQRLQAAL